MKNILKVIGFSFLGILLFGMFFTLINNDKNIKPSLVKTLSGDIVSVSGSSVSNSGLALVDKGDMDVETLLVEKEISGSKDIDENNSEYIGVIGKDISLIEAKEDKKIINTNLIKSDKKSDISKEDKIIINTNLIKSDKKSDISKEDKIIIDNIKKELTGNYVPNKIILPGVDLKTGIGKKYIVGVRSLKINNRTFTRKLGYLFYGDVLKQLRSTNIRGCFEMEVVDSKNKSNIGKVGYVCKKYLSKYIEEETDNNSDIETVSTKVGNVYSVFTEDETVKKTDKKLSVMKVGTIVEQVTNEDNNGCFKVLVLKSYGENKDIGKVGYVCKQNLEKVSFYCEK